MRIAFGGTFWVEKDRYDAHFKRQPIGAAQTHETRHGVCVLTCPPSNDSLIHDRLTHAGVPYLYNSQAVTGQALEALTLAFRQGKNKG